MEGLDLLGAFSHNRYMISPLSGWGGYDNSDIASLRTTLWSHQSTDLGSKLDNIQGVLTLGDHNLCMYTTESYLSWRWHELHRCRSRYCVVESSSFEFVSG